MNTIVYPMGDALYFNLTNRCTNRCTFCVRNEGEGVGGYDLWLDREPDIEAVCQALAAYDLGQWREAVYCGFGEPTMQLEVLLETAACLKQAAPHLSQRINTNGLANLYHGQDITPRLEGLIDTVSISLNAATPEAYDALCRSDYGLEALPGLLDFAHLCKRHVPHVVLSVVDVIGPQAIKDCQRLAEEAGVPLRIRTYIP